LSGSVVYFNILASIKEMPETTEGTPPHQATMHHSSNIKHLTEKNCCISELFTKHNN